MSLFSKQSFFRFTALALCASSLALNAPVCAVGFEETQSEETNMPAHTTIHIPADADQEVDAGLGAWIPLHLPLSQTVDLNVHNLVQNPPLTLADFLPLSQTVDLNVNALAAWQPPQLILHDIDE